MRMKPSVCRSRMRQAGDFDRHRRVRVFRADFKGSSQDNWLDEDDEEEETSSASA